MYILPSWIVLLTRLTEILSSNEVLLLKIDISKQKNQTHSFNHENSF